MNASAAGGGGACGRPRRVAIALPPHSSGLYWPRVRVRSRNAAAGLPGRRCGRAWVVGRARARPAARSGLPETSLGRGRGRSAYSPSLANRRSSAAARCRRRPPALQTTARRRWPPSPRGPPRPPRSWAWRATRTRTRTCLRCAATAVAEGWKQPLAAGCCWVLLRRRATPAQPLLCNDCRTFTQRQLVSGHEDRRPGRDGGRGASRGGAGGGRCTAGRGGCWPSLPSRCACLRGWSVANSYSSYSSFCRCSRRRGGEQGERRGTGATR